MPRDGNGTYTLPAGNPVVTGTTISSTVQNNTQNDVASALTASIANDGQTTPTADLKMGGFKHKNVGNASSRISPNANYASAADVQDGTITFLTGTAGTNTVTASAPLGLVAYAAGQEFRFIPAATNTGATTLNINSIGAKSIFANGKACLAGALKISVPVVVIYDGTQFHLIGSGVTLADEVAFTAGANCDVTGLPAGIRRLNIFFNGLSTNGTADYYIQLGTASGIETTTYVCTFERLSAAPGGSIITAGFGVVLSATAAGLIYGKATFDLQKASTNAWIGNGIMFRNTGDQTIMAGYKALAGVLDRFRLTTNGGADNFDAGAFSYSYE